LPETLTAHSAAAARRPAEFLGHPRALGALFFTETWERFSYYGMRAVLIYYLYYPPDRGGFGVSEDSAAAQVSAYAALIYMFGVAGGWVADRLAGARRTVLYGGIAIMCGHVALAIPWGIGGTYLGLGCIVVGTGLLKTNVSTMVGELYRGSDERRDAGFSLFYTGLSLGGFAGPLVVGWFQQQDGFHWAFATTSVGMALGLLVYVRARPSFGDAGQRPPNPLTGAERRRVLSRIGIGTLLVAGLLGGLAAAGQLGVGGVVNLVTWVSCALAVVYFAWLSYSPRTSRAERRQMFAYIPIFLSAVLFALLSGQTFTVLAEYASDRVDLGILGWNFPASWFASVDIFCIVLLAPVAALVWTRLGPRQPGTYRKMSASLLLVGLAVGEILLSPVGLAAATRLAPAAFVSQGMGLWFLSGAVGNGLGAQVVTLYNPQHENAYFGWLGGLTIAAAVLLFLAAPRLRPLLAGLEPHSGPSPTERTSETVQHDAVTPEEDSGSHG